MSKEFNLSESTIGNMKYLYHDVSTQSFPEHREIIKENFSTLHLVPYAHQIPDGFETLCYDLGEVHHGFISLVHVFHPKRPIKLEELILLIHGIVGTVLSSVKLGLMENSFVLEPKHVYMKRNSTQPQLVYVPIRINEPLKTGFGALVHYLTTSCDTSNPLVGQILAALKNIITTNFNLRDIATVVVQAANKRAVDKQFFEPPVAKSEPKGLFRRLVGGKGKEEHDDPFADFDARTVISMTDSSKIDLNVAALYVMDGPVRMLQIPITKEHFVMGRNPNEVDHYFEDKGISRIHAVIDLSGSGYTITDKGSSGGTYLNGARLNPGTPAELRNGDEVVLYKKKLRFEYDV